MLTLTTAHAADGERLTGFGSVTGVPHLPEASTETFESHYVAVAGVRLHAVIGGDGPALLLLAGWPQTWYAWRLIMPALARQFRVVAVDPRGVGLSDKPKGGYDSSTSAKTWWASWKRWVTGASP